MPAVWDGLIQMTPRYTKFPYTVAEQANIKMEFAANSRFRNVIREIDCTHIAVRAPSENEFAYVNKKHFHQINVQAICDTYVCLTNVVAHWPSSTPDCTSDANFSVNYKIFAKLITMKILFVLSRL